MSADPAQPEGQASLEDIDRVLPADLVDLRVVARRLDVPPRRLRELWAEDARQGQRVPRCWRLGQLTWRVSLIELQSWLDRQAQEQGEQLRREALGSLRRGTRQLRSAAGREH